MRKGHNCSTCIKATCLLQFASRSIGQLFEKQAHWGCSKPQSGPAAALQHESADLRIIGMTALISRTKGRRVAKRQLQWSTSASFRNPSPTSSGPREVHIHRSRGGDGIGGAATRAHTRSRCQRAKAQGPSQVGNPRWEPL
jgi:hypothetical protein